MHPFPDNRTFATVFVSSKLYYRILLAHNISVKHITKLPNHMYIRCSFLQESRPTFTKRVSLVYLKITVNFHVTSINNFVYGSPVSYRIYQPHYISSICSQFFVTSISTALCLFILYVHFSSHMNHVQMLHFARLSIIHKSATVVSFPPTLHWCVSSINTALLVHFALLFPTGSVHQPIYVIRFTLLSPIISRPSTVFYWFT